MPEDAFFARWSGVLYVFIALAALFTVASPLYSFTHECRLELMNGQETWKMNVFDLPPLDFAAFFGIAIAPRIVWLVTLWAILGLAAHYRHGHIFAEPSARGLVRIGVLLVVMGVMNCLCYPLSVYYLYWRGITPWLGDMSLFEVLQPDYVMAGLFFVILGNIMRRAVELEENRRLII